MNQPLRNLGKYASVLAGIAVVAGGIGFVMPAPVGGILIALAGLAAGTALISYPIYWATQAITQAVSEATHPTPETDPREHPYSS